MKNIFKRIISFVCAISLALVPVPAQAQEGAVIKCGTASGYAGNTVTLNFTAENLENLAALDMDVYYDPTVLALNSATSSGFSGASVDINTSTEGCVSMSMASAKGFSGSLTVLTLKFKISSSAQPGDYGVFVAIGDAFDVNLNPLSISRKDGKITVLKSSPSVPTAYFYASVSDSSLEQGDETKITYYSYTLYNLASGVFEITYDKELFEFVEFGTYASMQTADSVYSVNSDRAGIVKISYASSTAVRTGNLFYVKLCAIENCDATSTVEMTPSSLYAQDLSPINAGKRTSTISITKKYVEPEPEDHPDFWIEVPAKVIEGLEFEATVKIAGESKVAAGDFTVKYNNKDFTCVSVTAHPDVSASGGMVVVNKAFSNGEVKFSFVNENGISKNSELVVIKLVPKKNGAYSSVISTESRGTVYDSKYNPVELDYIKTTVNVFEKSIIGIEIYSLPEKTVYTEGDCLDVSGGKIKVIYDNETFEIVDIEEYMLSGFDCWKIGEQTVTVSYNGFSATFRVIVNAHIHDYVSVVTEPTCTEQGYTTYTCSACGDNYVDSYVDASGHTFGEWYTVTEATPTEPGEERHDCENCDYYETRVIPAKGYEPGDINLDGSVDVKDAYYARLVAAKLIVPTEGQLLIGDVDGDGKITAIDANLIRKFAVKIISSLPVEM